MEGGAAAFKRAAKKKAKEDRIDPPAPGRAPAQMKDAAAEQQKARDEARRRAVRNFGVASTRRTGSLGLSNTASTAKKQTLGE